MYAIVKTGGKQYKVAPGDKICIEKMDAEPGTTVELPAICVVDGDKVEADPAKAAATKVVATVLEHYKGKKQLVFKFKKRKNYKKLRGHRQQLMRVRIDAVGSEKAAAPKKAAAKKAAPAEKPAEKKDAARPRPSRQPRSPRRRRRPRRRPRTRPPSNRPLALEEMNHGT